MSSSRDRARIAAEGEDALGDPVDGGQVGGRDHIRVEGEAVDRLGRPGDVARRGGVLGRQRLGGGGVVLRVAIAFAGALEGPRHASGARAVSGCGGGPPSRNERGPERPVSPTRVSQKRSARRTSIESALPRLDLIHVHPSPPASAVGPLPAGCLGRQPAGPSAATPHYPPADRGSRRGLRSARLDSERIDLPRSGDCAAGPRRWPTFRFCGCWAPTTRGRNCVLGVAQYRHPIERDPKMRIGKVCRVVCHAGPEGRGAAFGPHLAGGIGMGSLKRSLALVVVASGLTLAGSCANDSGNGNGAGKPSGDDVVGGIGLQLQIAPGVTINTVNWTISNSTSGFMQSGSVNEQFSNHDLLSDRRHPAGAGYTISGRRRPSTAASRAPGRRRSPSQPARRPASGSR